MRERRDTFSASGQAINSDRDFLGRAVALAAASAATGGFPCGAVVACGGTVIGEGQSRATIIPDPTAHAEVSAIRAAAARRGTARFPGATLYSALEPCLMCLHAAYWAGIERIVYGAGKAKFRRDYYEGGGNLTAAAALLNREIRLEQQAGFEEELVALVRTWEERTAPASGPR